MSEPNERVVPIHTRRGGGGACPLCKKPSQADFRPFCSKRCADLDLSRWLNGVYAIPSEEAPPDEAWEGGGGAGRDPDSDY